MISPTSPPFSSFCLSSAASASHLVCSVGEINGYLFAFRLSCIISPVNAIAITTMIWFCVVST